jgi:hypothetical protein
MPDWQVLNARLSVFVTPDTTVPATLWRDLIGEEPESSTMQRALAMRTDTGSFADGTLNLHTLPMRIDWVYEPVASFAIEGGLPPVLGPFPGSADPLIQLGHRWATSGWFPSTPRIALGLILISAVQDRDAGYRELAQFIDGVPDASDAQDFQYQVNRPRPSKSEIEGLRVNRLSKWSVGAFRQFAMQLGTTAPSVGPSQVHLRLELDINTSEEFSGLIPRAGIESVVEDLLSGALEISERGNHL